MAAGYVAGVTRAQGMLTRCLGADRARDLASAPTLQDALGYLRTTPYGRGPYGRPAEGREPLRAAQRAVAATLLWHLRVLAGWQPPHGARILRLLASGFEIANVDEHVRTLAGAVRPESIPPYRLGSLATAWPRLSGTGSLAGLRAALSASVWGDPGDECPAAVAIGMRVSAADRTESYVPQAAGWAAGRIALLVGREAHLLGRPLTAPTALRAARVLGTEALGSGSFGEFRERLPDRARWAVEDVEDVADLWRAEARWWTRVERDGLALLRGSSYGPGPVVGAVAVLSADARRARACLELAARGGGTPEDCDALG